MKVMRDKSRGKLKSKNLIEGIDPKTLKDLEKMNEKREDDE